ncbi:MAG: NAD(P)-binding protein, partial [Alphaproteobacteria bacterium]|nr:NAD(P)-binding protein [Alphaproteobacteria bacterium]
MVPPVGAARGRAGRRRRRVRRTARRRARRRRLRLPHQSRGAVRQAADRGGRAAPGPAARGLPVVDRAAAAAAAPPLQRRAHPRRPGGGAGTDALRAPRRDRPAERPSGRLLAHAEAVPEPALVPDDLPRAAARAASRPHPGPLLLRQGPDRRADARDRPLFRRGRLPVPGRGAARADGRDAAGGAAEPAGRRRPHQQSLLRRAGLSLLLHAPRPRAAVQRGDLAGSRDVGVSDVLVVGAGFAGAVCARELAEAGLRVQVIDRRDHVAGNAFDAPDAHGVVLHRYGPHIFHTNSDRVLAWLSRFTRWRPYEHRVLAAVRGMLVPVPINRTTINRLYGLDLDEAGVARHLARVRTPLGRPPANSEELLLSTVGHDLCAAIFRGYSRKQWGRELADLAPQVAGRIPVRTGDDDRYFDDLHQCMPADGYAALFARILDHAGIRVALGCAFDAARDAAGWRHVVYTGPIDAWFGLRFGPLPYRSLRFEAEHHADRALVQPVASINHPDAPGYTRVTEFKHLTGQVCAGTT